MNPVATAVTLALIVGLLLGALITQKHHDSLWGQYNHSNGRKWGWRPTWKTDFSRK